MRFDIVEQARAIRKSMDTATANLTDEQAIEVMGLYMPWGIDEDVNAGDIRRYDGKLYRCLQAHTTQAQWKPAVTPALWVEVVAEGEYREIKDNMLPTEAFALGEIGWYSTKNRLYKSLIDNNVYTPVTYPAGWEAVV